MSAYTHKILFVLFEWIYQSFKGSSSTQLQSPKRSVYLKTKPEQHSGKTERNRKEKGQTFKNNN